MLRAIKAAADAHDALLPVVAAKARDILEGTFGGDRRR